MKYKNMREYTHEEFINIISDMDDKQLIEFSKQYGGYPVLFRMALDERASHIPFIQTGAAVIIKNSNDEILLQERTDREEWSLPGGCQELGEELLNTAIREIYEETGIKLNSNDIKLIDTLSGPKRKNTYPNGDIVYNNTSLYYAEVWDTDISNIRENSETKRLQFFKIDELPNNLMDKDLTEAYLKFIKINKKG